MNASRPTIRAQTAALTALWTAVSGCANPQPAPAPPPRVVPSPEPTASAPPQEVDAAVVEAVAVDASSEPPLCTLRGRTASASESAFQTPLPPMACPEQLEGMPQWAPIAKTLHKLQQVDAAKIELNDGAARQFVWQLKHTADQVRSLGKSGKLPEDEATLLADLLALRASEIEPPVPYHHPPGRTCYSPMPSSEHRSYARIKSQLPSLERLASAQTIHPAVVCKALQRIERDLAGVESSRKDHVQPDMLQAHRLLCQLRSKLP